MKTKICEITGEKMYKSLCCGKWEYDVTTEGVCQSCFLERIEEVDFDSPKIVSEFEKIEKENKEIIRQSKSCG